MPIYRLHFGALAALLALYACKNDPSSPGDDSSNGGGQAGDGSLTVGGQGGQGIDDPPGGASSSSDAGAGAAAGGSAAGGDGSAGESTLPVDGGYLLGPEDDDQKPIQIPLAYSGIATHRAGLWVDGDGNFFTIGQVTLAASAGLHDALLKYSPSLKEVWRFGLDSIAGVTPTLSSFSVASDGGIVFGGTTNSAVPGETNAGGVDAVIGRLTPEGELDWIHQWGSSGEEKTMLTIALPDGAVLAAGTSSGQAPGKPSTVRGGPWAARYEADGTPSFVTQYAPGSGATLTPFTTTGFSIPPDVFRDPEGNVVFVDSTQLMIVSPTDGSEIARTKNASSSFGDYLVKSSFTPASAASSATFHAWADIIRYEATSEIHPALAQFDLDGRFLSYREWEPTRSAVIDETENVIWQGQLAPSLGADAWGNTIAGRKILVTPDAIYLTGAYRNSYKNGSVEHLTTTYFFVASYQLDGDRNWFQEITLADNPDPYQVRTSCTGLVLDPEGNPTIAMHFSTPTSGGDLFKLSKEDGTLLSIP